MSSLLEGQGNQELLELEDQIERLLRRSMQTYINKEHKKISQPRHLQHALNKDTIRRLFCQYKASLASWQNIDVDELCNEVHQNYIIVLAMLIIFRNGRTIFELRNNGVSDAKLPLKYLGDDSPEGLQLSKEPDTTLVCFRNPVWSRQTKITICSDTQWELNVPYMKMGKNFAPEHREFPPDTVLPWCKPEVNHPSTSKGSAFEEGYGGYSKVQWVHIHPEYHGFREIVNKIGLGISNDFALKILDPERDKDLEKMYLNEIKQLKSFNGTIARHLVTLLATFTHDDKRHFLFPWAECSLYKYWDTQQTKPWNRDDVRWFSKQLLGIVEAVQAIHCPPHIPHQYGRHGDLKPDNILWYKPYKNDPKGILVVSDMGFTVAHRTWSRSKDRPSAVARTPDYRPPEMDTKDSLVSRKYDVWTLGCTFLEMLTWFLGGNEERKKFKEDRKTIEPKYGGYSPTFFTLSGSVGRSEPEANINPSVLNWMSKIRSHKYQSQFTDDVVNVIQKHMILIDPDTRADTELLKNEFTEINKKCQSNLKYCTSRTPQNDA